MGIFDAFKREDESEREQSTVEAVMPDVETLTVRLAQDKRENWRVSVVDGDGKTLLVRAGFGFKSWYDARAYAARIAAARLEIETVGD